MACEGFEQLDLLVGKRLDLRAADVDHTDGRAFAQQRRHKKSSNTAPQVRAVGEFLCLRLKVGNMDSSVLEQTLVADRARVERSARRATGLYRTEMRYLDHLIALKQANHRVIGPAHLGRPLGNRIEHRLNLGRRTGDDL